MLNAGITPVVHEYGSLGCSGDLAPLAHCALVIMGEGVVRDAKGSHRPAAEALAEAGLEPVELREKEGLALINGTDGMLGMLVLAIADLRELLKVADITAAMSVEGLLGSDAPFAADLQALRPHPGQATAAANMRAMLAGSAIMASHRGPECTRVQDAYSLRCAPQVAGAARDTVDHAALVASRELAAAIDNPVITRDGRVESNGNFHGAPLGYVLDFLAIAAADVASMSERRTDRFLDVARSQELSPFLAHDPGVDSGHMIAQYTQAAIVSELKRLAVPASVDSIPSSAMQEDHVSMGWSAARKLRRCGRRADPRAGDRAADRGQGDRAASAADAGSRHGGRARRAAGRRGRAGAGPVPGAGDRADGRVRGRRWRAASGGGRDRATALAAAVAHGPAGAPRPSPMERAVRRGRRAVVRAASASGDRTRRWACRLVPCSIWPAGRPARRWRPPRLAGA